MKEIVKGVKKNFYRWRGVAEFRLKSDSLKSITPSFYVATNIEAEKILSKDNEEELLKIFLSEIQSGGYSV